MTTTFKGEDDMTRWITNLAALLLALQVFLGFERQPVERASRRWVVVADDSGADKAEKPESAVEPEGQNPAA